MLPQRLSPSPFLGRRILVRRLLIGGAVVAILALGGSALIRDARGASEATPPTPVGTTAEAVDEAAARLGFRPRLGRHVVHAVIMVERHGKLATFQVDRGTIGSIGDGKLTVSEAGGTSVTVATNDQTRVRRDGNKISLADLKAGDKVYVISQASSGDADPVAQRIAAPTKEPSGT